MKIEAPNLVSLSAAATPGKWDTGNGAIFRVFAEQRCDRPSVIFSTEPIGDVHPANAAFICALVNAYREKRLVEMSAVERLRERAARLASGAGENIIDQTRSKAANAIRALRLDEDDSE